MEHQFDPSRKRYFDQSEQLCLPDMTFSIRYLPRIVREQNGNEFLLP